jgi:hypothetical protein
MKKIDTKLESDGAEFLVLGNLLVEGISAYKTYQNFPGYDLVVVNPEKNLSAKIQVKSRYHTDWDGFIINNFNCDFVIFVALNRGFKKPKKDGRTGLESPDFFVFPITYVNKIKDEKNSWGKIIKARMINHLEYQNKWELIKSFLEIQAP